MHTRLFERFCRELRSDDRDLALAVLPGMGLDEFLFQLANSYRCVTVPATLVQEYWTLEYGTRGKNTRFVLHAAIIRSLANAGFCSPNIVDEEIFRTNLDKFLSSCEMPIDRSGDEQLFIVLTPLDSLSPELMKLVCDEIKSLRDNIDRFPSLSWLRFVIAGSIDFEKMYNVSTSTGVSPATNFRKYYSRDFILSDAEASLVAEGVRGFVSLSAPVKQMIIEWSGGHLHYLREFANWVTDISATVDEMTSQSIIRALQGTIQEGNRVPLLTHCYSAWELVRSDAVTCETLRALASAGYVRDSAAAMSRLVELGLVLRDTRRGVFYFTNSIIELFFRQRLAELGRLLPVKESTIWCVPAINAVGYRLILEIESHVRTYIGDQLFDAFKASWEEQGLQQVENGDSKSVLDEARKRQRQAQNSAYYDSDAADNLLMYLDFSDLSLIVQQNKDVFARNGSEQLRSLLPQFMEEVNFHRRTIAHNRPISYQKIRVLEDRWNAIQKLMRQYLDG